MHAMPIPSHSPGVTPPLGPGDHDGIDRGQAAPVRPPLGPGDDDGIDRGQAFPVRPPLGPGESTAADLDDEPIVPRVAGPGDEQGFMRPMRRAKHQSQQQLISKHDRVS